MFEGYGTPRAGCLLKAMSRIDQSTLFLSRPDFNRLVNEGSFKEGPFQTDTSYGAAYNPHPQAYGLLADGQFVFCELTEDEVATPASP